MRVKDIFYVIDTSEVNRILVIPKTQPVLGQTPSSGHFISISIFDKDKIAQISELEVEQLSVHDGILTINI